MPRPPNGEAFAFPFVEADEEVCEASDPIQFALADLGLALVYAAVIPLVWSVTTSPSATTSPATSAAPAAHS